AADVCSCAAPDGRGSDAAETGCVTALPSTFHAVDPALPCDATTLPETGCVTGKFEIAMLPAPTFTSRRPPTSALGRRSRTAPTVASSAMAMKPLPSERRTAEGAPAVVRSCAAPEGRGRLA